MYPAVLTSKSQQMRVMRQLDAAPEFAEPRQLNNGFPAKTYEGLNDTPRIRL